MELRRITYKDWEFIREVRNDGDGGFTDTREIDEREHQEFMIKHCVDYYVGVDEDGDKIGFIGKVDKDVRFGVARPYRGRGLGTKILIEWTKTHGHNWLETNAKVHPENIASIKAFEKAGWEMQDIKFKPPMDIEKAYENG